MTRNPRAAMRGLHLTNTNTTTTQGLHMEIATLSDPIFFVRSLLAVRYVRRGNRHAGGMVQLLQARIDARQVRT